MKKIYCLLILNFAILSCSTPQIFYSLERTQPDCNEDSIYINLYRADILLAYSSLYPVFYIEIENLQTDNIYCGTKNMLNIVTDTNYVLLSDIRFSQPDTMIVIEPKKKYLIKLFFWKSVDSETFSSIKRKEERKMQIELDLFNSEKRKQPKYLIFKSQ